MIILDLMMPSMSGFEVADALKDNPRTADIPILVLTSKEISSEDRQLLHTKVSSFVQKGKSARDQLVREIRQSDRGSLACMSLACTEQLRVRLLRDRCDVVLALLFR